jgi:hypothetical protein
MIVVIVSILIVPNVQGVGAVAAIRAQWFYFVLA